MNEQALKDRLLIIAKEKGIHFNRCWKNLLLERFLARLSRSSEREKIIFKGGFLLSYLIDLGRETMDLDFLLNRINAEEGEIRNSIERVLSEKLEDGFIFLYDKSEILEQPHMVYSGYRITLKVLFGKMKDKVQIDIGIGDVVIPENRTFPVFSYKGKPLFDGEISLMVYPVETIFAEKLETIISKGGKNSRMKDYHDLLLLCREIGLLKKDLLEGSIKDTFLRRKTSYKRISFTDIDLQSLQKLWMAHRKGLGNVADDLLLPVDISEVISEINLALQK